MNNIKQFIQEKLVIHEKLIINKHTKIDNPLDRNINTLEELCDALIQYFDIDINDVLIRHFVTRWQFPKSNHGIVVKDDFIIKNFKNVKDNIRLKVGIYEDNFIMQIIYRDYKGTWKRGRIHGRSKFNKFNIGDNLYDFLMRIKDLTDEDNFFEKDSELVKLFKLDK